MYVPNKFEWHFSKRYGVLPSFSKREKGNNKTTNRNCASTCHKNNVR